MVSGLPLLFSDSVSVSGSVAGSGDVVAGLISLTGLLFPIESGFLASANYH